VNKNMRNIALLGGTGFLGKNLVTRLIEMGYQVRILTRKFEQHRDLLVLPKLTLLEADVYNQEQLNKQLAGCDAVINLIGILNETGRDGTGFHKAHVELAEKIIAACKTNNIKRLLHVSSLNANAKEENSHYLRTKGEAEDLLHAAEGLNVTSFKPSVIFGEDAGILKKFAALLRLPSPVFTLPSAQAKLAPVWVKDVVDAIVKTIDKSEFYGHSYNLCGPKVYTLQELVAYIAKQMGLKRYIIPLKTKGSMFVAKIMEKIPGKPYSLDNFHSSQIESTCSDNNDFKQLGITPHPLETVMHRPLSASTNRESYSVYRSLAGR
jgi:NADH dehydrogenase